MLFNPGVILSQPLAAARDAADHHRRQVGRRLRDRAAVPPSESTALMIAASRAQIGEFSFILAALGVGLGAAAAASGATSSLPARSFRSCSTRSCSPRADWIRAHQEPPKAEADSAPAEPQPPRYPTREPVPVTQLKDHVVLVGYGRVGSVVGADAYRSQGAAAGGRERRGHRRQSAPARHRGDRRQCRRSGAARSRELPGARAACWSRCPDGFEGGQVVEQARAINPRLPIIARSHSEEETAHLQAPRRQQGDHGRASRSRMR